MGRTVHIVFLTSGEQGVHGTAPQQAGPVREREAEYAAGKLGVAAGNVHFLRLPDGGLDPGDRTQFLTVLSILRQTRPEVVYVPHAADAAHDHQQAHLLVWRALEKGASHARDVCARRGLGLLLRPLRSRAGAQSNEQQTDGGGQDRDSHYRAEHPADREHGLGECRRGVEHLRT